MIFQGRVLKLRSILADPVRYEFPIGEEALALNDCLGNVITLAFSGRIECIHCGRVTKKSYSQGYCFPCSQKLARCDFCIVQPQKCHYHLGTCREPEWGQTHCFIPHIVYLANTSGLKVGITRETQVPIRWIDQGAIQALPILQVKNRYQAGLVEVELKKMVNDRTQWKQMIVNQTVIDLLKEKENVVMAGEAFASAESLKEQPITIQYPILEMPAKISALNLEKTPNITGTLLGIKGQYLLLDVGVLNIRNLTGYVVSIVV